MGIEPLHYGVINGAMLKGGQCLLQLLSGGILTSVRTCIFSGQVNPDHNMFCPGEKLDAAKEFTETP